METYQVWVWTMSIAPSSFIWREVEGEGVDGGFELRVVSAVTSGGGLVAEDVEVAVVFLLRRPSSGLRLRSCGQFAREVFDVHARAAVDVGRILAGHQPYAHFWVLSSGPSARISMCLRKGKSTANFAHQLRLKYLQTPFRSYVPRRYHWAMDDTTGEKWDRERCVLKASEVLKDVYMHIVKSLLHPPGSKDRRTEILMGALLRLRGMMITLEELGPLGRLEEMIPLLRLMSEWTTDCAFLMLGPDEEIERFVRYADVGKSKYLRNFESSQKMENPLLTEELRASLHATARKTSVEIGLKENASSWTDKNLFDKATYVDQRYKPPGTSPGSESYAFRTNARGIYAAGHAFAHPSWESIVPVLLALQKEGSLDTPERRDMIVNTLAGAASCMDLLGVFANDTRSMLFSDFFLLAERLLLCR